MATTDRRGVSVDATDAAVNGSPNPGLAIKAPARVATTANITLSGLQTIDGIALAAGDRVLVKDQTAGAENGVYNASTGSWTRTIDFDSNDQVASGLQVAVAVGSANAGVVYYLSTPDPIELGTTALTWSPAVGGTLSATLPLRANGGDSATLSGDVTISTTLAATSLAGNSSGVAAAIAAIALGATLAFSGSTLQTAAMTGDVTASANSFVTTIAANAVTYAKFQQVAASSLVGNATGALANATGITLGATLAFSGSSLRTGAMTGDVTASANSFVTTVAAIQGTTVAGVTGTGNVVFATSPTLATPTITTSATVPLVIGGTGAASTAEIRATSGVGAGSERVLITGGNNGATHYASFATAGTTLGATYVAADAPLVIMANTAATVAPPSTTLLHIVAADAATVPTIAIDSFGAASSVPAVVARCAGGTLASKTAVTARSLFAFAPQGWDGSAYGGGASQHMTSTETWSGSAHGSQIDFYVVANGTTTVAQQITMEQSGAFKIAKGVAIPAGGTAGMGYKLSSTTNFGIFFGSGAPSLAAAQGSLYLRSDGSATNNRAYINTDGSTAWTALTTVA